MNFMVVFYSSEKQAGRQSASRRMWLQFSMRILRQEPATSIWRTGKMNSGSEVITVPPRGRLLPLAEQA
jgi:hypothetical protein